MKLSGTKTVKGSSPRFSPALAGHRQLAEQLLDDDVDLLLVRLGVADDPPADDAAAVDDDRRRQGVHAVLAADGELVVDEQAQADVLGEAAEELDDALGVVDVQVDVEDRQVLLGVLLAQLDQVRHGDHAGTAVDRAEVQQDHALAEGLLQIERRRR